MAVSAAAVSAAVAPAEAGDAEYPCIKKILLLLRICNPEVPSIFSDLYPEASATGKQSDTHGVGI